MRIRKIWFAGLLIFACLLVMYQLDAQNISSHRTDDVFTSATFPFVPDSVPRVSSTGSWFDKPLVKDGLVPGILIGDGLATYDHHEFLFSSADLKGEIVEDYPHFHTSVDNYLQYMPAAETFALRFMGMQPAHHFRDQLALFVTTTLVQGIIVTTLKYTVHEQRPDGSDFHSFPSGHTTTAFGGAMFLYEEYKNSNHRWVAYTGFPLAVGTAALRLYNNKHWYADVAVGAGLGMLCTEASYAVLPAIHRWLGWNHQPDAAEDNVPWLFLSKNSSR
ncbi:MAG: phosphatase PAP2 family protein [Thermoflavifilum sp.]|uniref:phosphatase PAP2 family protein n=1 Tax=Thermoflavifilum sp. TaxID=1968839 RepID=UPI0018A4A577|nr:phosphatase PAP2 family protein [Thermoflavifilum sp.]QOR75963.1 MAG: phosphatase PAP2 family protein [Thermoflavifilum sp.]